MSIESHIRWYLCSRRTPSLTYNAILAHQPNPFCDSLRSSQDESARKQKDKLTGVIDALTNKLAQCEARCENLECRMEDERKDFEGRVKAAQDKMREEKREASEKVRSTPARRIVWETALTRPPPLSPWQINKAEKEARDAKSRAFTAETERNNEGDRLKEAAVKERELQVRVEELRTELAKADGGVEEARRLSKDRLASMQREHERVVDKIADEREEEGRGYRGENEKVKAEKRAMEDKVREKEDEAVRLRAEVHGLKMRMRFSEGTAPMSDEQGVFAALNAPSPMFSDDMGPATPIVIESVGDRSAFGRPGELEVENRKLKDMVGVMRKEMETLTKELMSPHGSQDGSGSGFVSRRAVEALEQQLVHAREYVVVLQGSKEGEGEVRRSEERSDEQTACLVTKTTRARTSVQYSPSLYPPQ